MWPETARAADVGIASGQDGRCGRGLPCPNFLGGFRSVALIAQSRSCSDRALGCSPRIDTSVPPGARREVGEAHRLADGLAVHPRGAGKTSAAGHERKREGLRTHRRERRECCRRINPRPAVRTGYRVRLDAPVPLHISASLRFFPLLVVLRTTLLRNPHAPVRLAVVKALAGVGVGDSLATRCVIERRLRQSAHCSVCQRKPIAGRTARS